MKRETFDHPKTSDLAVRLGVSRPAALGHLALLWHFTEDHAIQGNVGKWSDGAIARACEWEGKPEEFIGALVASGWIDPDEVNRLLIHDWADHCQSWVKAKMSKNSLHFIRPPSVTASVTPSTIQSNSNQSNSNQIKPTADAAAVLPAEFPPEFRTAEFAQAWLDWHDGRRAKGEKATETISRRWANKCVAWGYAHSIEAVNLSADHRWLKILDPAELKDHKARNRSPKKWGSAESKNLPDLAALEARERARR